MGHPLNFAAILLPSCQVNDTEGGPMSLALSLDRLVMGAAFLLVLAIIAGAF
jgi:hypothetical protein